MTQDGTPSESVVRAVEALDASVWDPAEAAEGAARIYADAGHVGLAFDRLVGGGRRLEQTFDFARAAELYHEAATLPTLADDRADEALVREDRARNFGPRASAQRTAAWLHLLDRASTRGDGQALARALVRLHSCDVAEPPTVPFLQQAAQLGEEGWNARAHGVLALGAGDYDAAIDWNQRAVAYARRTGDRMLEAVALDGMCNVLSFRGQIDEWGRLLRQSIAVNEEDGDVRTALFARCNLVESLFHALRVRDAVPEVAALQRSIPADERGEWRSIATVVESRVHFHLGELGAAAALLERSGAAYRAAGTTMTDCVALLTWVEVALDAGQLDHARELLPNLQATVDHVGVGAFRQLAQWFAARLAAVDDEQSARELEAAVHDLVVDDYAWIANIVGWALSWRSVVEGDAELARALGRELPEAEPGDRMVQAMGAARGAAAVLVDGDDRPMRLARRAWNEAGLEVEVLRVDAMLAVAADDRDTVPGLMRVRARLETLGALADADVVAAAIDARQRAGGAGVAARIDEVPALREVPAAALDGLRGVAEPVRIDAGDDAWVAPGDLLVVHSGLLRLTDGATGPLLGLRGAGSFAHARGGGGDAPGVATTAGAPTGGDEAGEVVATALTPVVAWTVPTSALSAWLETLAPEVRASVRAAVDGPRGAVGAVRDTRAPVAERIAGLLLRLVDEFGSRADDGSETAETGLNQDDLATLAATSRKTATLTLSQLRKAGIADARRGTVQVFDRAALQARATTSPD